MAINRKDFLKTLGGLALFTIVPRRVLGGPGHVAPNDQLTKGIIGTGGIGRTSYHFTSDEKCRLVALCDVDSIHLDQALEQAKTQLGVTPKTYHFYRDLINDPDVDVVHIATPPHWHGIMSVEAAKAGKDIWCEKPMTRTIGEGKRVMEAVRQNNRIFRLNTWFRFQDTFYGLGTTVKPLKKLVDSGMLGWPLKVTISGYTGFNWKFFWVGKENLVPQPVPKNLDYDLWLGPAPFKPYNEHRTHQTFRGYWDYDGGGLGDMGQHYIDPVQYILGKIILQGEDHGDPTAPYIEGPKGKLYQGFNCTIPNIMNKLAELPDPEPQNTDFIKCIRNREKFALNEMNGFRSATIVNMGLCALRLNRSLEFDPVALKFINDDAANALIDQPMRAPWKI